MTYPKLEDKKYKVKEKVIRIAPATRLEGHAQINVFLDDNGEVCLLYTSPSPRDRTRSRMPSSA